MRYFELNFQAFTPRKNSINIAEGKLKKIKNFQLSNYNSLNIKYYENYIISNNCLYYIIKVYYYFYFMI